MNAIDSNAVLECVKQYTTPDKRITKAGIASYLKLPYSNSHNNQTDRSIRDAITELRKNGHPICSEAGRAGYWYSSASVNVIIADYESRIIDMSETVRALKKGVQVREAVQMRMQI
jgi:hypothetical protein